MPLDFWVAIEPGEYALTNLYPGHTRSSHPPVMLVRRGACRWAGRESSADVAPRSTSRPSPGRPGGHARAPERDRGSDCGLQSRVHCIKAFFETDQTDDLKKMTVPTLFIHGDDDQIVPIGAASPAAAKIAPKAQLKVYPGAPHGLTSTHKDQVNADLLAFIKA